MNLWKAVLLVIVLVAILFLGCSQKADAPTAKSSAPLAAVADLAEGATLSGKVSFKGTPPKFPKIEMDAEPVCARLHGGPVDSQVVVVNDNGTLRNVLVYVKDGLGGKKYQPIEKTVTLDQHGCMYEPHVLALVAGQQLEVTNSDETTHNIHPMPLVNREWNESQSKGDVKKKTFSQPEFPPLPVKCNIHPWMKSYIGVFTHPFFAVSGADGKFTIRGLPPGTYTIGAWQEKYGEQTQTITVKSKEAASLDFSFKG